MKTSPLSPSDSPATPAETASSSSYEKRASARKVSSKGSVRPEPALVAAEFLERVTEAVTSGLDHGGVSVKSIARAMNLTEQSFRRRFHKHASSSPKAFFSAIQMEKAADLLTGHPGMSVAKVALMCGYETNSSFCHKFKDFYGCSPSEYRLRRNGAQSNGQ